MGAQGLARRWARAHDPLLRRAGLGLSGGFYARTERGLVATPLTSGPWSAQAQHGGPPSALIVDRVVAEQPGWPIARVMVEFLRPIALGVMDVQITAAQRGRSAVRIAAMLTVDGRETIRGSVLLLAPGEGPRRPIEVGPPPSAPAKPVRWLGPDVDNYGAAVRVDVVSGDPDSPPVMVWMEPRVPLVAGEPLSAWARAMIVADSIHGVARPVDLRRFTFINPELTVHFLRPPEGERIGLQSDSGAEGTVGLASARLHDARGVFAVAAAPLVIAAR